MCQLIYLRLHLFRIIFGSIRKNSINPEADDAVCSLVFERVLPFCRGSVQILLRSFSSRFCQKVSNMYASKLGVACFELAPSLRIRP